MKKTIFMALVLALVCSTGIVRADELGPLYDGTNSSGEYVPLQGGYIDRCQRVQVIYPKGDLAAMAGKSITKMTFYIKTKATKDWNAGIEIALAETDDSNFDSGNVFKDADFTTVYSGSDLNGRGDVMEVAFSKPFAFSGSKNLLFELRIKGHGASWSKTIFYAKGGYDNYFSIFRIATSDSEEYDALTTGTNRYYSRPKTLFTYEESAVSSCAKPTDLNTSTVEAKSVSLNWSSEAEKVQFALVEGTAEPSEWSEPTADASKSYDDLKPETKYSFYVRSWCSDEEQSDPVKFVFTTEKACFEPEDLKVSNIGANSATLTWNNSTHGEIGYEYLVIQSGSSYSWDDDAIATTDYSVELTPLLPQTDYIVYVRSLCEGGDKSAVVSTTFTTPCGAITVLPWSEDFTGVSSLPDCWSVLGGSVQFLSGALLFNLAADASRIAVLPEFEAHVSTLKIKLAYNTENYNAALEIGYLTNAEDASTFVALKEFGKVGSYESVTVYLSEAATEATRIALRASAEEAALVYVDDISVDLGVCDAPTNVTVNATENSAEISWEDAEGTLWDIEWKLKDADPSTSLHTEQYDYDGLKITIPYLEADADYVVRIARIQPCVSEYTEWIEFHTGKTPTNVEAVEGAKSVTKRIEDGQLVIIRDGVRYNAIGVEVQ